MARIILLVLGVACAGAAEENTSAEPVHLPEATGAEVELEVEVADNSDGTTRTSAQNRGGLVNVYGGIGTAGAIAAGTGHGTIAPGGATADIAPPRSPPTAQEQAARAAQRQSRIAAAEAEYQQRCGRITLAPGQPPAPPQAPSTPGLQALRPVYEVSLAGPVPPPSNNSTASTNEWAQTVFASWIQTSTTRLRALSQAARATPESDRQYARVWIAHAQALFVERLQDAPIPDEVARDPEQRRYYVGAIATQGAPLIQRVVGTTDGVTLPGPWAQWKSSMQTWLAQEACALH